MVGIDPALIGLCLLAFFWPGCPCCGGPCPDYCSDDGPAEYEVVLSGMADDLCTDCGNLDGTYVLDRDSITNFLCPGNVECAWANSAPDGPTTGVGVCTYPITITCLSLVIQSSTVISVALTVYKQGPGIYTEGYSWKKTFGSDIDCSGLSGEDIPYESDCGLANCLCDPSGATVEVTAL